MFVLTQVSTVHKNSNFHGVPIIPSSQNDPRLTSPSKTRGAKTNKTPNSPRLLSPKLLRSLGFRVKIMGLGGGLGSRAWDYIRIMERKWKHYSILGSDWDNGKENGNYYNGVILG